jgi:hypothetical protein
MQTAHPVGCAARGAEGIRTPDPLHAMEVRYQLRYSPATPEGPASIPTRAACADAWAWGLLVVRGPDPVDRH